MAMPSYRDRLYADYDAHAVASDDARGPHLDHFVRTHLPRGARVLDLGCGDGGLLRAAQRAGHAVVRGVDGSAAMVARGRGLGTPIEHGDLLAVARQIDDRAFDCVVAYDVLEHLDRDEQLALLDQAQRILSPGGRLVLHVPSGEGIFGGAILYGDATHLTAFTPGSLNQLFRATGFVTPRYFEERPYVHGLKSAVRLGLWHAFRAGVIAVNAIETGWVNRGLIASRNLIAVAHKPSLP